MPIVNKLFSKKGLNLDTLSRVSNQKYIPEIDALRFLAIIPVMLMHFGTAFLDENGRFIREAVDQSSGLRQVMLTWDLGVMLFFGISGFVLTYPFFKKSISELKFKSYYIRRLVRIEPPYIIALTLFLAVHIMLNEKELLFLLERYGFSLLYIHEFVYDKWSYILPVAWSLEIEVQFYILMPLLLLLLKLRDSIYWRGLIYAILLASSFFLDLVSFRDVNDYMIFFLPGIIAADLHSQGLLKARHFGWTLIFLASLAAFFFIHQPVMRSLSLFLLIFSAFRVTGLVKVFTNNRLVVVVGGMCYTLYLLHYPIYIFINKIFSAKLTFFDSFELNYIFQALIFIPLSIFLMSWFFLLIEKPFMVLSQRMSRK